MIVPTTQVLALHTSCPDFTFGFSTINADRIIGYGAIVFDFSPTGGLKLFGQHRPGGGAAYGKTSAILHSVNYASKRGAGQPRLIRIIPALCILARGCLGAWLVLADSSRAWGKVGGVYASEHGQRPFGLCPNFYYTRLTMTSKKQNFPVKHRYRIVPAMLH